MAASLKALMTGVFVGAVIMWLWGLTKEIKNKTRQIQSLIQLNMGMYNMLRQQTGMSDPNMEEAIRRLHEEEGLPPPQ